MINTEALDRVKNVDTGLLTEGMNLYSTLAKYVLACPQMQGGEFGAMGFFSAALVKNSDFVDSEGTIKKGAVSGKGGEVVLSQFIQDTQMKYLQAVACIIRDELPDLSEEILDDFIGYLMMEESIYDIENEGQNPTRINPRLKNILDTVRKRFVSGFDLDAYVKEEKQSLETWSLL